MKDCVLNIHQIIREEKVTTMYQPIVSLSNGEIIGYEALSRGPVNTDMYSPLSLIAAAEKEELTWELEMLFRRKAIETAESLPKDKRLFVNVDPKIFSSGNYQKGFTKKYLSKYNINIKNIVFEITERTSIDDYNVFKKITQHYRNQGYTLAIDDVGSGYSGLKSISELKPNYIKIDMDIIRNIDTDNVKQAIIGALVMISRDINTNIIAEGIETYEELQTLIRLSVQNGQGYLLCKPIKKIIDKLPEISSTIRLLNKNSSN